MVSSSSLGDSEIRPSVVLFHVGATRRCSGFTLGYEFGDLSGGAKGPYVRLKTELRLSKANVLYAASSLAPRQVLFALFLPCPSSPGNRRCKSEQCEAGK